MTRNTERAFSHLIFGGIFLLLSGFSLAHAAGESLQISGVSPTGGISASTTVTFSVSPSGFTSPKYSVSDSFNASGATVGTIDKFGFFTWTPKIYDAGKHTITVTATDSYTHVASTSVYIFVRSSGILLTSLSPGPIVKVYRPLTFKIVAPGSISPRYSIYGYALGGSLSSRNIDSTVSFSWTPGYGDVGQRTITIAVDDSYGNSAQAHLNLSVINPSVSIQSLNPGPSAEAGLPISFVALSPGANTFTVADTFVGTSTLTSSSIASTGVFSWKPIHSDVGVHTIVVTAADLYGNAASTTITLVVSPSTGVVPPPVASSTSTIPIGAANVGPPSSTYVFSVYLGVGSRGAAVLELQKRLSTLGFYSGPITGFFGPLTSAGVKIFQSARGVSPLGFVGPATRAALNR